MTPFQICQTALGFAASCIKTHLAVFVASLLPYLSHPAKSFKFPHAAEVLVEYFKKELKPDLLNNMGELN